MCFGTETNKETGGAGTKGRYTVLVHILKNWQKILILVVNLDSWKYTKSRCLQAKKKLNKKTPKNYWKYPRLFNPQDGQKLPLKTVKWVKCWMKNLNFLNNLSIFTRFIPLHGTLKSGTFLGCVCKKCPSWSGRGNLSFFCVFLCPPFCVPAKKKKRGGRFL